jgi:Carboxypeptidase regulatory-like domain
VGYVVTIMHRLVTKRHYIIVFLFCLLYSPWLFAQVNVTGMLVDPDGAAISGVQVILRAKRGKTSVAESTTDPSGRFRFEQIFRGDFELEVPATGGFDLYQASLHVTSEAPAPIKVSLALASVSANVTVASDSNEISPDQGSNRDQVTADAKLLEKVPVFDQNYITALTPFLDQTGVATAGVSIIVDGVEMKGTGVSASAIAEAHINNDPYSAETNRPGKGRIEIITKPGTAQIHGTLNFTFRDSVLDAKNYFAQIKPFEQKRIYEGSITGPIGRGRRTTFLLSGSRQEDKLQSIVYAITPTGLVTSNAPTPFYDTEFAARVSHDLSASHRVSLQYNVSDTITRNQGVGGLVLSSTGVNAQTREDDVIFNDRIVISPTLLNQLQLFFEKDYDPVRSVSPAQKIVADGNFTSGGAQADFFQTENNLKINDIVSWSHKRHFLKFGVNVPNLSRRAWEDRSNRVGTFNFASLGDYQSNTPYSFTQQAGAGRTAFWINEIGTFIQDQIQVRSDLQVSFGLRYDWQTYFKSIHDFAPRASVAYTTPDHKSVFRAGAGIFYDRSGAQPIADLKRYNGVILRSITLINPTYPIPYASSTDLNNFPTNLVRLQSGGRIPYITNFSMGVERQLVKGLTLAVTYRGTVGIALFRSRDINAPLPPLYAVRPDPDTEVLRQIESEGRQIGNALDLTVEGKTGRWFSGMAQYTFSHTNNNTRGITWFPANQYDLQGEYGRADFDQRHRFNLLGTFNEDHWLNLGVAAKLYSGTPYTETSGVDEFNTGILNARLAGVTRNTLQTAGNTELDLRWNRDIPLPYKRGDVRSIFSCAVDVFNVTNATNYISYVGNVRSFLFEQPTAALPARRLQLSARFRF